MPPSHLRPPAAPRSGTARFALLAGGLAVALATTLTPAALAQEAGPTPAPDSAPTAMPTDGPSGTPSAAPTGSPAAAPTTTPGPTPAATPATTPAATPATTPTATPTATSPTAAPDSRPVLRLGVSTTLVRGNGVLTVSGRMYSAPNSPAVGTVLDVLGRTPGTSGFARIGRMTTDADGLASLRLVPRVTREYRLRTVTSPALVSADRTVQAQPLLTGSMAPRAVRLGRGAELTGRLTPAYAGATLQVQRRVGTGWGTVALVRTDAAGAYRWQVRPGSTGRFVFRAVLPAAPAHRAALGAPVDLVVENGALRRGDRGPQVLLLQQRLAAQKADVGRVDGVFGTDLVHAVTAFQKSQGLPRTGVYDAATSARLASPRAVVLRHPARGRAVEVDLTKQVLYVSEGGRLTRIVDVSTGNDEQYVSDGVTYKAFTPVGGYSVQRKIDGIRVSRLGELYRPAYFHRGWAIHGSPNVPVYPDSHGCVRVTNGAMDRLYGLLTVGVPVSLYR